MKKILIFGLLIAIAGIGSWFFFFKEPDYKATNGFLTNVNKASVILDGYDPVAYFTDHKPMKGNPGISFRYEGAIYYFSSDEHADLFKKNPAKYAPQYGGFCGYAVSIGKLRPVDPAIFQIENGRLILQHTQEAYDLFNQHLSASIMHADQNWPGIVANHAGKPVMYDMKATAPTAYK